MKQPVTLNYLSKYMRSKSRASVVSRVLHRDGPAIVDALAILDVSAGWALWLELRVAYRTAAFCSVGMARLLSFGLLLLIYQRKLTDQGVS